MVGKKIPEDGWFLAAEKLLLRRTRQIIRGARPRRWSHVVANPDSEVSKLASFVTAFQSLELNIVHDWNTRSSVESCENQGRTLAIPSRTVL
jgi:hypothetical protein